jgi:hypothetical protein
MGGSIENCVHIFSTDIVAARREFAYAGERKSTVAGRLREPVPESTNPTHTRVVRVDE